MAFSCKRLGTCCFIITVLPIVVGTLAYQFWPAHTWPQGPFPTPLENLGFRSRYVEVEPGVDLFVVERPGTSQELAPLVFVHGTVDSWRSYEGLWSRLGTSRRLIAYDLRGHGNSSKPSDSSYTVSRLALDLKIVMDALEVHEIGCLIGHSLGSYTAWYFAGTWPERVRNLLLIGTTSNPSENPIMKLAAPYMKSPFISDVVDVVGDFPYTLATYDVDEGFVNASDFNHWLRETMLYESTLFSPVVLPSLIDDCSRLTPSITEPIISRISAQTLVIHGAMDTNTPVDLAKLMVDVLPKQCHASLQVVPGQGHAVHWTNEGAGVVVAGIFRLLASEAQHEMHSDAIYQSTSLATKQVYPQSAHFFLAVLAGFLILLCFSFGRSEKPSSELSLPLVVS